MPLPWIPPIPGGKLTSKPVRALGPAVVFLLWCYDAVKRDATIEFQVNEVAGYLDESYYTVRKWWAAVKDGPWFAEVTDRGKLGFRVQMADEWLEWRAVKSSSSCSEVPDRASDTSVKSQSSENEVPELVLENEKLAVKLSSTRNEAPIPVLEDSAYKVLHDDHESRGGGYKDQGTPAPFFQKLAETCNIPLALASQQQRRELGSIASALSEIGATAEQLDAFSAWWWSDSNWRTRKANKNNFKPEAPRPREVQEEWGNAVLPAANGHKPNGRGPPEPTKSAIPADARSTDETARRLVAELRKQRE